MSLETVLKQLEMECEQLSAKIEAKRPESDADAFMLLRARSLSRTFLRLCLQIGAMSTKAVDAVYAGARKRVYEDEKPEIQLPVLVEIAPVAEVALPVEALPLPAKADKKLNG